VMFGRTTAEAVRRLLRGRRDGSGSGADLDSAATPGPVEVGRGFYTVDGAFACAKCWARSAADESLSVSPRRRSGVRPPRARPRSRPRPGCASTGGSPPHDRVARVEVTFRSGQRPDGQFDEPSDLLLADKAEFGSSRVRRWFDRGWASYRTAYDNGGAAPSTQNSWPSGSAMTTQLTPPWPMSTRVAPRARRRSTSAC
jgi:hypothetical protein